LEYKYGYSAAFVNNTVKGTKSYLVKRNCSKLHLA